MTPEQFKEILDHQSQFLEKFDKALDNELHDCSLVIHDFKQKVLSHIKWGILRREKKNSDPVGNTGCVTHWGNQDNELIKYVGNELLFMQETIFNTPDFFQAPIFFPEVTKKLKDKEIQVFFDNYNYHSHIVLQDNLQKTFDSGNFLKIFKLQLMLPDIDLIFPDCQDIYNIPEWLYDYVDSYEEFKFDLEKHDSYLQIGGYGRWIQGPYENYIGQVNNDIGDCGAVFIYQDEQGKFSAHLDMH